MSTTQRHQQYDCARTGCENDRTPETSVAGSYCSAECRDRDRGAKFLSVLRWDHRFCGSCYRPRKVVFRPADSECAELRKKALIVRESFVGFEELTEHATHGQYGVECNCGSVDHHADVDLCRDGEAYEWWLKRAVDQLREEGKVDYHFDIGVFADAHWSDDPFDLAVGRALE